MGFSYAALLRRLVELTRGAADARLCLAHFACEVTHGTAECSLPIKCRRVLPAKRKRRSAGPGADVAASPAARRPRGRTGQVCGDLGAAEELCCKVVRADGRCPQVTDGYSRGVL